MRESGLHAWVGRFVRPAVRQLEQRTAMVPATERLALAEGIARAARPCVDYFVMIALSSIIASLGLLLNSPAVIIGAMLVAPLMSAIVGLGLGIIRGSPATLKTSSVALLGGAVIAVLVGIIAGWVSPGADVTTEIASRARPGLLDLVVALASGAAAAYASCRKDVSAALVGVAIAVSLVPPLATVGIGVALLRFDVAGGALLLFLTNLIAIVAASGLVFLALGFAPYRIQHLQRSMLTRGVLSTVVLLVAMTVALTALTIDSVRTTSLERAVRLAVEQEVQGFPEAELEEIRVERGADGGVRLAVTLRSTRTYSYEEVVAFQAGVATRLQLPTALVLQVVPLVRLDPLIPPTFTPTATSTNTPTPTCTPTSTRTSTSTATPTTTPTASGTSTFTPSPSPTDTPAGTGTASPTATDTGTAAALPTALGTGAPRTSPSASASPLARMPGLALGATAAP